jgi:hypothetical protein
MPCVTCCHPSLFAGIRFPDSKTPSKTENTWIIDRPSKKQCFSIFSGFLFAQTLWWGAATTFYSVPWTSCGMVRTSVWVIEHFRCSCALNSPGDVFLFSRRNRELAKPRSAGDDCITHHDMSLPKDGMQFTSSALRHIFNPRTAHFHHHSTQRAYKLMSTCVSKRNSYHFCWGLQDVSRPMFVPYQSDSLTYTKIRSSSLKSDAQIIDPRPHLCANWTRCDIGHLQWQTRGALICRHLSSNSAAGRDWSGHIKFCDLNL